MKIRIAYIATIMAIAFVPSCGTQVEACFETENGIKVCTDGRSISAGNDLVKLEFPVPSAIRAEK